MAYNISMMYCVFIVVVITCSSCSQSQTDDLSCSWSTYEVVPEEISYIAFPVLIPPDTEKIFPSLLGAIYIERVVADNKNVNPSLSYRVIFEPSIYKLSIDKMLSKRHIYTVRASTNPRDFFANSNKQLYFSRPAFNVCTDAMSDISTFTIPYGFKTLQIFYRLRYYSQGKIELSSTLFQISIKCDPDPCNKNNPDQHNKAQ
jgi:hypothetical protein